MKQLIIIIGPNGVGKSTTAKKIVEQFEKTAYVDSDWCRVMNPFAFTETTKPNDSGKYLLFIT
jgi:adenylate kinase family enzyme